MGVAAVAVTAVLLVPLADGSGGEGKGAGKGASPNPSPSPAATASTDPPTPTASASPGTTAPPTVAGTSRPASLPPGARKEAGLYAWVPPEDWQRVAESGAEVHYTSPDRAQEILANAQPADGHLLTQWRNTEEKNTSKGAGYRKIRLERTTFRGRPAVVWEYRVTAKGDPWHVRLLGFREKGMSYEISTWYHPDTGGRAVPVYEKVRDSFTPL